MASSNRHWPSLFKSKHQHHHSQRYHDINPTPFSSGGDERSHEAKPRWNPKPEQIRILEAIFNSGMVNPPRDEIRRIRTQLQEYGQVGDANVFYWFQNRKSRNKHKQQRHLQNPNIPPSKSQTHHPSPPSIKMLPPSSSSSSSDISSQKFVDKGISVNFINGLNSPTASVNQPYFNPTPAEPYLFPVDQPSTGGTSTTGADAAAAFSTQGFCFTEESFANVVQHANSDIDDCSSVLFADMIMNLGAVDRKFEDDEKKFQLHHQQLGYTGITTASPVSANATLSPTNYHDVSFPVPSAINHIGGKGAGKSTVFINEVAYEVPSGPLNVREAFGEDAMLVDSSCQPVVTNEWGVTLRPLQHGSFYYLLPIIPNCLITP